MSSDGELPPERLTERAECDRELRRVFPICNECRRCRDLCPVFPALFEFLEGHGGDASALRPSETGRVLDLCFQCKRCFDNCPYTPPHPWEVDFPFVILRADLARKRESGLSARDRFLGHPDLSGAVLGVFSPIWNRGRESRPFRFLLEKALGIDREGYLPRTHGISFERWFRKREKRFRRRVRGDNGKVALFYTCSVNVFAREIGQSAVAVLHHNDIEVAVPPQRCCGAAHLEAGDLEGARQNLEENARTMLQLIDAGYTVVAPQPACSHWLRLESARFSPSPEARRIAERTLDLSAFLLGLQAERRLATDFRPLDETLALHVPCRLRAQRLGPAWADLLGLIPGLRLRLLEECAAMEGAWGLKKEFRREWREQTAPLRRRIEEASAGRIAADCFAAAVAIRRATGRPVAHPIEILREAYGLELPA